MVHGALNPSSSLTPGLQVVLAGIKMEDPTAAGWWNDNRDELKKLTKWEDFALRVRNRLIPAGWKIESLRSFYSIHQGTQSYGDFVRELQTARNMLGTSGAFALKDFVFKNHLLFHAQEVLTLRIMAIPSFNFETITVDGLISLMTSTSDSMLAEGIRPVTPTASAVPRRLNTPMFTPSMPSSRSATPSPLQTPYTLPELTYAERQNLKAQGGCYHCHLTPASPGWTAHFARDCPGDSSRGIPSRRSNPMIVAAVGMSSCVIGGF
jgi:hypothetical protein